MIQKWLQEHWLLALGLALGIIALISITVASLLFPPITTFFIGLGVIGFHPFAIIASFSPVYAALTCGLISAFATWSSVALGKVCYEAGVGIHKWYLILFKQQDPPIPPELLVPGGSIGLVLTAIQLAASTSMDSNTVSQNEKEQQSQAIPVPVKNANGDQQLISTGDATLSDEETDEPALVEHESAPTGTSFSGEQTILR